MYFSKAYKSVILYKVRAFILQDSDAGYWGVGSANEAVYLHKLCVRRTYAHQNMTEVIVEAIKEECRKRGVKYIRLDTGLDEKVEIVDIIDYPNGKSLTLYEMAA